MHVKTVTLGDGRRDRGGDARFGPLRAASPADFLEDHQFLAAVRLDGDGRRAPPNELGDGLRELRDRLLDVVGIVVPPANDDDVFDPTCDEQLASRDRAEVARSKERPLPIAKTRAEGFFGQLDLIPVSQRDAGTGDPDLTDDSVGDAGLRGRIDDDHRISVRQASDAYERPPLRTIRDVFDSPETKGGGRDVGDERTSVPPRASDHEGRLGQPVTRKERSATEAAALERSRETLHGERANRLGAGEGEVPAPEVELGLLLLRDSPNAEIVREVRPSAHRRGVAGDRLEPTVRPREECERRESGDSAANVERGDDSADEPHVVVRRQPKDERVVPLEREHLGNPA